MHIGTCRGMCTWTDTPKPWYSARGPPSFVVFFRQSISPVTRQQSLGNIEWTATAHESCAQSKRIGLPNCRHKIGPGELASELPVSAALANVSSQAGTGKVQRVHDQQGASASQAARRHVGGKEPPEVRLRQHAAMSDTAAADQRSHVSCALAPACRAAVMPTYLWVVGREEILDGVLERKVERLGRKVPVQNRRTVAERRVSGIQASAQSTLSRCASRAPEPGATHRMTFARLPRQNEAMPAQAQKEVRLCKTIVVP